MVNVRSWKVNVTMNYFFRRFKKINTNVVFITVTVELASRMVVMADSMLASQGKEHTLKLAKAFAQEQSNVNAPYLYDSGQVILENNIKHLFLLIPNEGHHGQDEEDDQGLFLSCSAPIAASGNLLN
jgi:hypothetical protein